MAWKLGCKGVTVYREGSRDGVMISDNDAQNLKCGDYIKRPKEVTCDIYQTSIKHGGVYFVVVGHINGVPLEVFAGSGDVDVYKSHTKGFVIKVKRGHYQLVTDLTARKKVIIENIADSELIQDDEACITRMVSFCLRHRNPIGHILDVMERTPGHLNSFGRAIARCLNRYVPDGSKVAGVQCRECKQETIVRQYGCKLCENCGWTACG